MRDKIYDVMSKLYGILMSIAFWGGLLPLLPFIAAIIIGGPVGEAIALFLYKKFYPWVIALASIAVIIGLIAMYIGGKEALSSKSLSKGKNKKSPE